MNKKTDKDIQYVIELYVQNKKTVPEIKQITGYTNQTIINILKLHNIVYKTSYTIYKEKLHNEIMIDYENTNTISYILKKYKRHPTFCFDILSNKNVIINDSIILDIFIINGCLLNKPRLMQFLKYQTKYKFVLNVINYLNNRYADSDSLYESIARIYNKIEHRPVCKQCGGILRYQNLTTPFNLFCSRKCSNNNEETKQRLKETCMKKYGVDNTAKAECVKAVYRKHMEEKYGKGIINSFQAREVIEKLEKTKIKKYGSRTYNNRIKAEETCIEKYGVRCTSQVPEIRKKQQYRYTYNNISFDSQPEIALYIYLTDYNIKFEYQPNIKFEYEFKNKKHFYYPDFKIENEIWEIKGDHLYEAMKIENTIDNAKYQCMIRNNVKILRYNDYKKYLDYIKEKYGTDYLTQFKNHV